MRKSKMIVKLNYKISDEQRQLKDDTEGQKMIQKGQRGSEKGLDRQHQNYTYYTLLYK